MLADLVIKATVVKPSYDSFVFKEIDEIIKVINNKPWAKLVSNIMGDCFGEFIFYIDFKGRDYTKNPFIVHDIENFVNYLRTNFEIFSFEKDE
jgi:hypothetical protein